jgi:SAM-dependent methyltransferase
MAHAAAGRELRKRYTAADLAVFTRDEARRFVPQGDGDPRDNVVLAWELLYRLEPELYDRLASVERLHPGVVGWLPSEVDRIAEVGAGTGRLTMELVARGRHVVAVEPALPLRRILRRKLATAEHGNRVQVVHGFFDQLPLPDDFADLVVACSAFTPSPGHGGDAGLAEMERVCRPGGCVAIIWPNHLAWLAARGYRYVSFPGPMSVEFKSYREAAELTEIFYPGAADTVRRRGERKVPFEMLGINPPRDLAFRVLCGPGETTRPALPPAAAGSDPPARAG